MSRRSLLRPSIGVNVDELAGKIAQDMVRAGDAALRAKADRGRDYERHEEWYVIGRRTLTGGYVLETVEPVLDMGILRSGGPTLAAAKAEMQFGFACQLAKRKLEPNMEAARARASRVSFYVADIIGEQ